MGLYRLYKWSGYFAVNLKDNLDRYFLTGAKQIRDKIQLGISIAVTNWIKSIFVFEKYHQVLCGC